MDIKQLIEAAAEMQKKVKESEESLKSISLTGESLGGMIKVTMNAGLGEVQSLHIDKKIVLDMLSSKDIDSEISVLCDLLKTAFNSGVKKCESKRKNIMPSLNNSMLSDFL